jgi:hypothetical protein
VKDASENRFVTDPSSSIEPEGSPAAAGSRRRFRVQLGLQRLILLIAALAVWMTVYLNQQHSAVLGARIKAMVPLAHELIVDDPSKVAVVKLEDYWMNDDRWDISLPPGSYRLCIATRKIANDGLAPVNQSVPIRSGRHQLALLQDHDKEACRIQVTNNGEAVLIVQEPKDWDPRFGSQGGGQFSLNEQLPPDKPIVLYRRQFMQRIANGQGAFISGDPTGNGILLWIERVDGSNRKP